MDKVVLGLSGGVDSAVAAHLLRESGLEVYGLYLDNGLPGADAAREAAASLSVPLTITDSREAMEQYVCTPFAEAYLRGETPNPCILCNPAVKFRTLLDEAKRVGAKYIATGHYARAENGAIYRGQPENDQSYMLCRLTPDEVNALLLPLAPYKKTEVRALAEELGLPVAHKPDSMDICFIPDDDYAAWIERRGITPPPGDFVLDGKAVGKHRGIHHYTVGQRRHFGVGFGKRVYVSDICPETNEVRLSSDDAAVWRESFRVRDVNWLVPPEGEIVCGVRIRNRPLPCAGTRPHSRPDRRLLRRRPSARRRIYRKVAKERALPPFFLFFLCIYFSMVAC
mgnify:CR=1 FL=1